MNVAVDVNMDAGDGEVWGSSICFRCRFLILH